MDVDHRLLKNLFELKIYLLQQNLKHLKKFYIARKTRNDHIQNQRPRTQRTTTVHRHQSTSAAIVMVPPKSAFCLNQIQIDRLENCQEQHSNAKEINN